MKYCFCNRLYRMSTPTAIAEYVFSGSLCRIRKFEKIDETCYCLTIFNLSDYKHLHFPHYEYELLSRKLSGCITTQTVLYRANNPDMQKINDDVLSIKLQPFDGDFKIKFVNQSLTIGPVTAYGIVNTHPFAGADVFSVDKIRFTCDSKWDICICGTCPIFRRMCDFEASAREIFSQRKPENIVFTTPDIE